MDKSRRLLRKFSLSLFLLGYFLSPAALPAAPASDNGAGTVTRFSGFDRYETTAKIAEQGWPASSAAAILAGGADRNLVDVLTATPLAKEKNAPILITDPAANTLNTYTAGELKRLQVKTVYVVAGKAVVTPAVLQEIKDMGIGIVSLGGYDQFATAVNIARQMGDFDQLVVATGWKYADAASIAAIAASRNMPILLSEPAALPDSVKAYLDTVKAKVDQSYVIGGTAVVGESVFSALPNATRIAGYDRYDTNLAVLRYFAGQFDPSTLYLANGEDNHLVDALVGSSLAALTDSAVLLVDDSALAKNKAYVLNSRPDNVIALGGEAVLSSSLVDTLSPAPDSAQTPSPPAPPSSPLPPVDINARWVATDETKMSDNLVYQQFQLVKNDGTPVSLAGDNVLSIKVRVPGGVADRDVAAGEDPLLWFNIQQGNGEYVYTVVTKDGNTYGAELDWEVSPFTYRFDQQQGDTYLYKIISFTPGAEDPLYLFRYTCPTTAENFDQNDIPIPRTIAEWDIFIRHDGVWYKAHLEQDYAQVNKGNI